MTGNGNHTTHENGDDWGMVYDCFTHITSHITIIATDSTGIWMRLVHFTGIFLGPFFPGIRTIPSPRGWWAKPGNQARPQL